MLRCLTAKRRETLDCVRRLTAERGFPPLIKEVGAALGIGKDGARRRVITLVRCGYARYEPGVARSLEALPEDGVAEERGNAILLRAITELAVEVEEALAADMSPASRRAVAAARKAREVAKAFAISDVDKLY